MRKEPIKSIPYHYVSSIGEVFKIFGPTEKKLPNYLHAEKLYVKIEGQRYEIIYLMLEAFKIAFSPTDRIKFRVVL